MNENTPPEVPSPASGAGAKRLATPHVEPTPEVKVPEGAKESGRYSAYDKTYLKYVGGVHDTEAKARKAAKDAGVTDFAIVQV